MINRYRWKIFKEPPRCWCKHWRYAKNTWATPSRASPRLHLDSCAALTRDHSPSTTRSITTIAKLSKVPIANPGLQSSFNCASEIPVLDLDPCHRSRSLLSCRRSYTFSSTHAGATNTNVQCFIRWQAITTSGYRPCLSVCVCAV